MKLYNKSGRGFIIKREDAIEGCRFPADDIAKVKAYIDPNAQVEVTDLLGEKLLNMYPKELMQMDKPKTEQVKVKKEKKVTPKKVAKKKKA